jgi:hypothetical protein
MRNRLWRPPLPPLFCVLRWVVTRGVALLSSSGEAALALVFRLNFSFMFLCFMFYVLSNIP